MVEAVKGGQNPEHTAGSPVHWACRTRSHTATETLHTAVWRKWTWGVYTSLPSRSEHSEHGQGTKTPLCQLLVSMTKDQERSPRTHGSEQHSGRVTATIILPSVPKQYTLNSPSLQDSISRSALRKPAMLYKTDMSSKTQHFPKMNPHPT